MKGGSNPMTRDIDRMELPQWYDENILTMLVVSPHTVFLYWELAFGQARTLSDRRLVLRLYEVSPRPGYENVHRSLVGNVVLPPLTGNWYFNDLQPGRRYRAELGWEKDHRFYCIIKSNSVELPPATPSDTAPEHTNRQPLDVKPAPPTETPAQTIRATVRELIDSMSFYMGMTNDTGPERK